MARAGTGLVELEVAGRREAAAEPQAVGHQVVCQRCEAVLATRADLRRVRHVLLRCNCGAFQRVALAEVA